MKRPDVRDTWQAHVWKQLPERSGIYIIWFEGTSRAYIGSTNNIARRVRAHLTEMVNRWHKMHGDLCSLGCDAVRAAPVALVDNLHDLPVIETYWINEYRRGGWTLYNTDKAGKVHRDRAGGKHER